MALQIAMPDPTAAASVMPTAYTKIASFTVSVMAQTVTITTCTWRDKASCDAGVRPVRTNSYQLVATKSRTADGDDLPSWDDWQTACQAAYSQVQTWLYGLLKSLKAWKGALDV